MNLNNFKKLQWTSERNLINIRQEFCTFFKGIPQEYEKKIKK